MTLPQSTASWSLHLKGTSLFDFDSSPDEYIQDNEMKAEDFWPIVYLPAY